ncbi:MAG: sigma-70 family RNA polymerase sigma factor [Deltaproteobacteria bacterium]|nr:sigma-70 family RNA polymerase sigma factor [Deltaproteobacteria bacterium]
MTDASPSDHELLVAWGHGDEKAGTVLVRRHFESLSRFFRGRAPGQHVDLMQKAWLGCVESRDRIPPGLPFKVYLMGIARRVLLHYMREHYKALATEPGAEDRRDSGRSPSMTLLMADEEKLLLQALRRLSLDMQLTLELFYWEELSVEDVATVLGIPPGTVKSRLHHAKRLLREQLDTLEPSAALVESTAANLEHWARSIRRFLGRPPTEEGAKAPSAS